MGTRADFYVGRGEQAEWLGSVALDGYPDGIPLTLREIEDEETYRIGVDIFLAGRRDATQVEQGWPWPWEDSSTSDYAYAYDEGQVWASGFGGAWFKADEPEPVDEDGEPTSERKVAVFPNMKAVQNVTMGPRSGLIVIGGSGD